MEPRTVEPMRFLLGPGTAVFYRFCLVHGVAAPDLKWRSLLRLLGAVETKHIGLYGI